MGWFKKFSASKEAYQLVWQLEKITVQKSARESCKMHEKQMLVTKVGVLFVDLLT